METKTIVLESTPWVGYGCKAGLVTAPCNLSVHLCLVFAGVWPDGLCAGPGSKRVRLEVSESQSDLRINECVW